MIDDIPQRIQNIYSSCNAEEQAVLRKILEELSLYGESETYKNVWLADYKEIPVDKYTFITNPYYLGKSNNNGAAIYPAWMDVMLELERTRNQYYEIVFTGATRTGKTSTAVTDAAYMLYWLMCLRNPAEYFALKDITVISIFFFNITQTLAKGVAFKEFNTLLSVSPYFLEHGHMSASESNPVYIPEGGQIEVSYGSDSSHALGRATFLTVFDECNFAAAGIKDINKAKERMKAKYDTLVARVTGTFVRHGEVYGKLYVISSKNSDSDFMEDYVAAQRKAGNPHMYIFDKPQWEVWPKSKYSSDKMFYIALGGRHLRGYVVPDDQTDPQSLKDIESQGYKLMKVPEDNKTRFLADFDIALRDIAGVSVPGTLSYITQATIDPCINHNRKNPFYNDVISIGTKDTLTLEEFFHINEVDMTRKHLPMFIHLDLSLTTDRTGISGVWVSGSKEIATVDETTSIVSQPTFTHVFTVALQAPKGDKIPYSKILGFICWLRRQHFNIAGVSRDQFQSEHMAQLLEEEGFTVSKLSLDRSPQGYDTLKSVLLEQRIDMLDVQLLQNELIMLQRDSMTGKIDHPQTGCFTADTKIALVDGRNLTIQDLLVEQTYRTNWVYTINESTLNIEPKRILSVHQTMITNKLLMVELDNGETITCTPSHRFMMRDGQYEEIQNLRPGDSLMPLYRSVCDSGLVGYRLYFNPGDEKYHFEHRQFCPCNQLKAGYVIHHKNYNKLDNCPTNLVQLTSSEHRRIHNNATQDYSKTAAGVANWHKKARCLETYKLRSSKISAAVRKHNELNHPEWAEHAAMTAQRIRDIEDKYNVIWDTLSAADRRRIGSHYARIQDPSINSRTSASLSKRHAEGKFKNAEAAIANRIWYTNGVDNLYIKKSELPPEGYHRGRTVTESAKLAQRVHYQNMSEEKKARLRKIHSEDTSSRIWVTNGIDDKYIKRDADIPEGYHKGRCKIRKNHKIVAIYELCSPCKVYDLTIEDNPNFALSAGVFVHNSKDASDSFAGAVWNATINNPGVTIPSTKVASVFSGVNGPRRLNPNNMNGLFGNFTIYNNNRRR